MYFPSSQNAIPWIWPHRIHHHFYQRSWHLPFQKPEHDRRGVVHNSVDVPIRAG